MPAEEILFITHKNFADDHSPEGGVKYCTLEYIALLESGYKVNILKVEYNRSFLYRVKAKLGIDAYEDYDPGASHAAIALLISRHNIRNIFINLSNASQFAGYIKTRFPTANLKLILCSHGNESGDFLHQSVRFKKTMPFFKRIFSTYRLGLILKKELLFRLCYFDLILTVSEIEKNLEYWLGAKCVYMVPRVFKKQFLHREPIQNTAGFIGDLSHYPNHYGLSELCAALEKIPGSARIKIFVSGHIHPNLTALAGKYKFLHPLGYLDNEILEKEASGWCYFLNPVFYYSKGVSTKLEKAMNWGLPVLSTPAGNRGYEFGDHSITTYANASEMASALIFKMADPQQMKEDKAAVEKIVSESPDYKEHIKNIQNLLENIS